MKDRWLWSLYKPWQYSPLGYVLAVVWNITEYMGVRMPFAPYAFGIILGKSGNKV